MEIWAINKQWQTLKTFQSFEDANNWWTDDIVHKDKFQILYRETQEHPIFVYKSN